MGKQVHTAIQDVKRGTHPFGIPTSTDDISSSQHTTSSMTELVGEDNVCKRNGKLKGCQKLYIAYICIAALLLISVGSIGGLVWTFSDTGQQLDSYSSRINALEEKLLMQEKENHKSISRIDALEKRFPYRVTPKAASSTKALFTASSNTRPSVISTITSPRITSTTTTADRSTISMTQRSTAMPTTSVLTTTTTSTSTTTSPYPFAFRVLQTNTVAYSGVEFLALQVRIPDNGMSKSENWCRDYQLLCAEYGQFPTGCGADQSASSFYKECSEHYASVMNLDNVLGCNPSTNIAEIANISFPNSPIPPSSGQNSFGFHLCGPGHCNKNIRDSDSSIAYVRDFWDSDKRIMYTVCRKAI